MRNLNGKRVLITGAGHGLGRALAVAFAQAGGEIIVTDIFREGIEETVGQLREAGHAAFGYVMDVTDAESIRDVRIQVHAEHGPVDVLVNNAGIVQGGRFLEVPLEKHHAMYEINTLGVVNVTHVFLPDLLEREEGQVVIIGSAAGMLPLPFAATYASSKSAVYGFSESLREELRMMGKSHVGVTAVCPSYLSTGLFAGVCPPRFTKMLTPEALAARVIQSVRRNKDLLLAPWVVNLIPLSNGLLPRSLCRRLLDWLRITTGMRTWHGHSVTAGGTSGVGAAAGERAGAK